MPIERVVTEEVFLAFVKDLFDWLGDEKKKLIANAEEGLRTFGGKNEKLAFYFRGYKGGVEVLIENFVERLQHEAKGEANTAFGL